ncbi:hypothetical protein WJX72_008432 [[Myrmecia] bisecta]|uniref:MYND-type domain-containing protein n=1 Tax=[Myrmecia] bisecta TaxID=41462 RepID=A0AAW1QRV2_9CHLO
MQEAGYRVEASIDYIADLQLAVACFIVRYGPVVHKVSCTQHPVSSSGATEAQARLIARAAAALVLVLRRTVQVLTAPIPAQMPAWDQLPAQLGECAVHPSWNCKLRDGRAVPEDIRVVRNPRVPRPENRVLPDSTPKQVETCAFCGQTPETPLKVCGRCRKAKYCNEACQRSHYRDHKTICNEP